MAFGRLPLVIIDATVLVSCSSNDDNLVPDSSGQSRWGAGELTVALTQQDMPEQGMKTIPGLQYYCMTPYDDTLTGVHVLFPKENVVNSLGEYISKRAKSSKTQ